MLKIRAPKDFWTGIMFIAFAAVAMLSSRNLALGTALRMGPSYFPMLLGGLLAAIGAILVVRSLLISGEPVGRMHLLPLAIVAGAVALFGAMLQTLGLVISLSAVVAISAFASRESRPLEVAALTLVLAVFSVLVFVTGLRLPLPVWPQI
jgi:hypothetical protein